MLRRAGICAVVLVLGGCGDAPPPERFAGTPERKPATEHTRAANAAVLEKLPFDDTSDFERARRGRLSPVGEPLTIAADAGGVAWDLSQFSFLAGPAPDTVNPSLWRQAQLNAEHGLFEVVDGIYQVRGYDISNVTFVRGATGWIVIDPLISAEVARAALALVDATLGERPVTAIIYSHSHADHFGGVAGVLPDGADGIPILAPEGFTEHSVSENVLAGNAMTRRATYMYGGLLPAAPDAKVDSGLGKQTSQGGSSLLLPTEIVSETPTRRVIDGVEIVFQNTPGAEAPAEMMFYLPAHRALCVAEEANAVLHNLYTLRGAQVRSGELWAQWLDEAIRLFGGDLDVVFGSHHWPRWGREEAIEYLEKQRDVYRYIHDQTVRLANEGLTPREIAETLRLPDSLALEWYNRDYYGTVRHNSKATYQLYLGWFDGNPANLDPLPPVDSARRYVEFMGGADAVIGKAKAAFDRGEYRWVAEVVNHVVFADPENEAARYLQADALEQLGYQAESGPWRNFYLTGAQELRSGVPATAAGGSLRGDLVQALTSDMVFDLLAVRLNGSEAAGAVVDVEFEFTDRVERWRVLVENAVLHAWPIASDAPRTVGTRLAIARGDFLRSLAGGPRVAALVAEGRARIDGDPAPLATFAGLFAPPPFWFEIVRP
jgi:alkyl sulfatase BDS1-like metallo-beta-lactamase superfamily hydrolase